MLECLDLRLDGNLQHWMSSRCSENTMPKLSTLLLHNVGVMVPSLLHSVTKLSLSQSKLSLVLLAKFSLKMLLTYAKCVEELDLCNV